MIIMIIKYKTGTGGINAMLCPAPAVWCARRSETRVQSHIYPPARRDAPSRY